MPRTIVLTLAPPRSSEHSRSEYWSVCEDGRICDSLCWDEMLGTVARITMNERNSYTMQTLEEHKEQAVKREQRRPDPMHDRLRDIVKAFDAIEFDACLTDSARASLKAARDQIAKADELDVDDHPF